MSKPANIYLEVIAGAFVTIPDKKAEPLSGRMLIKVAVPNGEDIFGFLFRDVQAVDSCMTALHRIRQELTKDDKIHPALKGPTDGNTH